MATDQTVRGRSRTDQGLYIGAAVIIPIVVLIGFARTYYLKGFFGSPALPGLLVHLHGAVMTSWVVLFVTQVSLVAAHRTRLHRRLGGLGAALAATLVVVGVGTAISAARRGGSPSPAALQFLAIPLFDMLVFAILAGTALYLRRRTGTHKRLMLLASLTLISAAIARIPLHFIATGGPLAFFALTDLLVVACVLFDTVKNRRIHTAFLWATPLVIASQPLRILLAETGAWIKLATWLTS
jgi:hypothetical protein